MLPHRFYLFKIILICKNYANTRDKIEINTASCYHNNVQIIAAY